MWKYEIGDKICFNLSLFVTEITTGEIISRHLDVFGKNAYMVKVKTTIPGLIFDVSEESIIKSYITKKENLIPEKVIFNREKGKTTLLFKGNGTWCYEEFKKKRKEKEFKELRKQGLSSEIYKLETKVDKLKKDLEKLNDKRN